MGVKTEAPDRTDSGGEKENGFDSPHLLVFPCDYFTADPFTVIKKCRTPFLCLEFTGLIYKGFHFDVYYNCFIFCLICLCKVTNKLFSSTLTMKIAFF